MAVTLSQAEIDQAEETRSLDLSGRALDAVPDQVWSLKGLRTLNLAGNRLTEIPPQIRSLASLHWLDLSTNQLTELSGDIGRLTKLQTLRASKNRLQALTAQLGQLIDLQTLDVSDNQLPALPPQIGQLAGLQTMDVSGNQLITLSPQIGLLTALVHLKAANNRLTVLPPQIGQLGQLVMLNLGGNRLTAVPAHIGQLKQLRTLVLDGNRLEALPAEIGELSGLANLYLSRNQITALPPQIGQLGELRHLDLARNRLAELPPQLGELMSLQGLDLQHNRLTTLPQALSGPLRSGLLIALDGNPMPDVLLAVIRRGREALATYLESLADAIALYEAKMVLVGEGNVGKTSLLATLRLQDWQEDRTTTHGIEVHSLLVPHPRSPNQSMLVRAWDFGGQEVYRITHQFFFSPNALYLLVWQPREGIEQNDVDGWLRRIRLRVKSEASVIIVATHGRDRRAEIDYSFLQQAFPKMLAGNFTVDNKPPASGFEELRAAIARQIAALPTMGQYISARWIRARDTILSWATDQPQIPFRQFAQACEQAGITEQREQLVLADLLHTLGLIIYYSGDDGLRDVVVLNPEWLTKAISRVLEDEQTRLRHGVLDHSRLPEIWGERDGEPGWSPEYHPFFLRLMEKFDISYRLSDQENMSLVGQLVPYERPPVLPWDANEPVADDTRSMRLVCQLADDAPGLIAWMTVRQHRASTNQHWRSGVFLRHPVDEYRSEALLELLPGQQLLLEVRSPAPNYFFHSLRSSLEGLIQARWPGLEYEMHVPCLTRSDDGRRCSGLFPLLGLERGRAEGDLTIRCLVCNTVHDISELLFGFPQPEPALGPMIAQLDTKVTQVIVNQKAAVIPLAELVYQFNVVLKALASEVTDCPRLFNLAPGPKSLRTFVRLGVNYRLTLWCEHPDNWHPCPEAHYVLHANRDWLIKIAPYARTMLDMINLVLPIAGSTIKMFIGDGDITDRLDQMKELIGELPEVTDLDDAEATRDLAHQRLSTAVGASARLLRHTLAKADPPGRFGGLRRFLGPDGDFVWICPEHHQLYDPGLPQLRR